MFKHHRKRLNDFVCFLSMTCLFLLPYIAKGMDLLDYSVDTQGDGAVLRLHFSEVPPKPVGVFLPAPPRLYFDFPGVRNQSGRLSMKPNAALLKEVRIGKQGDGVRVVLGLPRFMPHQVQIENHVVIVALGDVTSAATVKKTITPEPSSKITKAVSPHTVSSVPVNTPKSYDKPAPAIEPVAVAPQVHLPDTVVSRARKPSLLQVDFRREGREGRVIFRTSAKPGRVSTIAQQGRLVVQLDDIDVPVYMVRRFDVRDFDTLVRHIDVVPKDFAALANIQINGGFTHTIEKKANTVEVLITPLQEAAKGIAPELYQGRKLTLDFQDIDVRSALQVFADFTGLNVVVSDSVGGRISLRMKDVPWDEALDTILRVKNLGKRQIGNTLWIAPLDEIRAQEEGSELPTEVFRLRYQKAEAVANLLLGSIGNNAPRQAEEAEIPGMQGMLLGMQSGQGQPKGVDRSNAMVTEKGRVLVDGRTNTLFVQETAARIEAIRKLISIIDIPQRQVMIEARIVIADENFARELGARLGFKHVERSPGRFYSVGGSGEDTALPITGTPDGTGFNPIQAPGAYNVDLPANPINSLNPGMLAMSIIRGDERNANLLNLELSALESDSRGKVVSSPKVFTANLQTAYIEQGVEIPYYNQAFSPTTSGLGGGGYPYSTVSFKKAVLRLDVTPQITPDNRLILDLEVTKEEPDYTRQIGVMQEPPLNTRKVSTQVEVNNGDTAVLGGVFEQNQSDTITKVPFLGDVPMLGALFRTKSRSDQKTELLIFITPRIMPDIPPENS